MSMSFKIYSSFYCVGGTVLFETVAETEVTGPYIFQLRS